MSDELTTTGLGRAELHEMGIVFPKEMEYAEWEQIGSHLQLMSKAMPWWVGDWLNFGESKYGETYAQAIAVTGKEVQTLTNWKSVAKHVPLEVRNPAVSWSQHAELAALPPEEQTKWLDLSVANAWTREELRKAMKALPEPKIVEGNVAPSEDDPSGQDDVPFDQPMDESDDDLARVYNLLLAATKQTELQTVLSIVLQAVNLIEDMMGA